MLELMNCTEQAVLISEAETQRSLHVPHPILPLVCNIRRKRLALPCSSWRYVLANYKENISELAFVAESAIVVSGWMVVVPAEVWEAMVVWELAPSLDTDV